MNEVAVTAREISRHECWEDAIARVCAVTGTVRGATWLRGDGGDVFVFDARPDSSNRLEPIAWVTDPVEYQAAKSRGDLEDIHSFSHAGPEQRTPTRPTTAQPRTT